MVTHKASAVNTINYIGGAVLKESHDLVIFGVTFDSKMTFEKHLRSVSRAASQRHGILKKSWRVLNYWTVASVKLLDLKLLDRAVSAALFLTGGVFECDIAHRRSVVVLCMLYKIMCHPLNGALPGPYVPVRVTLGALVASVHLCATSL